MKSTTDLALLDRHLAYLCLSFIRQNCQSLATEAARKELSHLDYLAQLAEGEASLRQDRAVARRIKAARFPVIKTLDSFRWPPRRALCGDWPKKINRLQIQDLFRLQFVEDKANVIFLGLVGLGKTHLATALGYAACLRGKSVLFANAIDVINTLSAAQNKGALKAELRKYLTPAVLLLDELGYLPIDQRGSDLLFQVISQRYERGSIVLTTNKAFKQWPAIFNGDSTITSAVLDRLLHHAEVVLIEGTSYRMKDRLET
ncbi:MAG: IS21-like element helper ATPase IstB [Terrimicrobiaceae bacterium]